MHRSHYVEGTELQLCDLDPKVKVIGKNAGICHGVPSIAALVKQYIYARNYLHQFKHYVLGAQKSCLIKMVCSMVHLSI